MPTRYDYRTIFYNENELYDKIFEERHVKGIRHYDSPDFDFPTQAEIGRLTNKTHVWKTGDRYYKLAIENYGSARHWWVIALYNRKPTEASLTVGDVVYVPYPLEDVLRIFMK